MLKIRSSPRRREDVKLLGIFRHALDAIVEINHDGLITDANPSALKLFKRKKSKVIWHKLSEILSGNLKKRKGEVSLRDGERVLQYTHTRGDVDDFHLYFFRDITDLKMEMKRREHFIGIAGHELKNPLAVIKAINHTLLRNSYIKDNEELNKSIRKIDYKTDVLNGLISDLLDITKINQHKLILYPEKLDIKKFVNEVIQDFTQINKTHTVKFVCNKTAYVFVDKIKMGQAVMNLLKNASKYSPLSDKIMVVVGTAGDFAFCRVVDYGIGISRKNTKKIFDLYYRLQNRKKNIDGLGVGLL